MQPIKAFRDGEERGFDYFFRRYYRSLCYFARRYVDDSFAAEDIVSQCFINTWAKREQIQSEVGLKSYLYKAVYHASLRWLEKDARKRQVEAAAAPVEDVEKDSLHHLIRAETFRQLQAAIDLLPPECRKVFIKLYVEGKTVAEAAKELQLAISTVKNQKARGIRLLRSRLPRILAIFAAISSLWLI